MNGQDNWLEQGVHSEEERKALAQAYEDLNSFIYTVSHELKTPAREIRLYAEFIEEDNRENLLPQSIKDIRSIRRTCDSMTMMVQRLMEYSKAGFKIIERQPISVVLLVRQCFDEIMRSIPKRKVELIVDELPEITGDLFLIKLMITNILSNSIKFTREKASARIRVTAALLEDVVEFRFRDNGIGFDMAYVGRIFEAFQRLQDEGNYEGSGIGLATVQRITERLGGRASIIGWPGKGCEVTVSLPAAILKKAPDPLESGRDVIKIGIIGDFTGMCCELERGKQVTYKFAADEINWLGGILGKKVELLFRDDRSISELTRAAAKELTEDERVDVLMGSTLSPSREVMRHCADQTKTLFFDTQQTEGGVSSHYTFCLSSMPEQQMTQMLAYLIRKYGRKCYVVAADYNYGILSAEWVKYLVPQLGGEIVGTEYLDDQIADFNPLISRIIQVEADILFSILVFPNHDAFYLQWHERGLNHIPNASTMVAAEFYPHVRFPAPVMENAYVMASFIEELDTPSAKRFVNKFRKIYDQDAVPYMSMDTETVYTAMYAYKRAVEIAGTASTEGVIAALESGAVFVDGPGGRVTVRGEDHHTVRSLHCFRIGADHKAEDLFSTSPIRSNYVETMIEQTLGVKGGIKAMGSNTPSIQYNMLLNKFRWEPS
ncbi:MAG: ABC transporter substrate-binding protein [Gracilibacteraceae bacterium]|jgi:urea ABC transporter substrate-binding protein|nr:ABC transporter substrate-binding protein [Gracilibacteraceae bacterium]